MNLGYWKRAIDGCFTIQCAGESYQGYLKEVRRGRWLVFDIPLVGRDEWRTIIDRHDGRFTFQRV